ncbi:alpha-tocopherol transfer protein-like [Armigeres subalbatus]|uniref:alpha-tocopherol transfer protein-like n=1 Tax=Armigeres subalbatus TaxID=124917 RepID=UPI002ED0C3FE
MSIKRDEKDIPFIDLGDGFKIYVQADEYTDPVLKAKAKAELNETPETVEKALSELRCLLKEEKNLFIPVENDSFLVMYLRPNHYDVQKTFQMIQNAYRLKSKSKEYYEHTPNPSSIRHVFDEGMIWFMPERDTDGAALCVVEVGKKWNTSKVSIVELIATIRICVECALLDPETQLHGIKVIFDTEGLSMSQIAQNTPKHACMILDWVQKACPFRLRGVHVVNNSMLFNILFAIFKPFISKELREKIFFHNKDWKSLTKQISPSSLRPKYGGSLAAPEYKGRLLGDFMQLYDKHFDTLDSYGYVDTVDSQRRSK